MSHAHMSSDCLHSPSRKFRRQIMEEMRNPVCELKIQSEAILSSLIYTKGQKKIF